MKNKKINLKTLKNVLSEKELKDVVGGSQNISGCGLACVTDEQCPNEVCPECRMDPDKKHRVCLPVSE